ncbi:MULTISPECIES: peptide chain release factor N(5)-glutamine methyltransferase [unclassified Sphingomonas]|uniref:peptide chain release factor N(5)-glutamine methyltransferase n=1 Tax=unclassified Sphingomonas TaxID=196159 RepID=UPI0006F23694|nr:MULTISPECIES: peptide chain release factor N(5)-glutamine methyltransferase [unclassified Sphingomonas]KQM61846.1 protein-(glutamine-N5) methyltransferase, release factor-specific [Sphingomonas sp. Leaf16]KQN13119.1 protein-(glutamine-N5) methyltransferase, release factor-specific [Sphingomonas sp. Leaf29]KQN20005.1 protein-(glutamine-N5) methyltransferase, release factor-specific [Sphingomonas sp. Leaf32]
MTTLRHALTQATARIAEVSDSSRLDAELLAAHALGCTREAMLLARLNDPVPVTFDALVERRLTHEPVAYITGSRAFWTIDLMVGPGVLVPRADSETLIEAAVVHFAGRTPTRILDLGTGPGTLLLAALAEWPQATGLGVDASTAALDYARRNGVALGMGQRVTWQAGDWTAGIDGRFDLILANPPYIGTDEALPQEVVGHEPAGALFAGRDGLDDYRRIVPDLSRLLAPGGIAAIEIGHEQGDAVATLVQGVGLPARLVRDLGGRPRCVVAG